MFDPFERKIRRTLRRLARQRVRLILPPDVLVIERSVPHDEQTVAALRTCWLRGWAELVHNAVPTGEVPPDGRITDPPFTRTTPIYRITDSGWSVVHRSHMWAIMAVLMGFLSVCAGFFGGILVQTLSSH